MLTYPCGQFQQRDSGDFKFRELVWSENSSGLAVSEKLKFFDGDEFIDGAGALGNNLPNYRKGLVE